MPADAWVAVTCTSRACLRDVPNGRVLFRRRGPLVALISGSRSVIALTPVLAVCRCGAVWKNPDLDALVQGLEALAAFSPL